MSAKNACFRLEPHAGHYWNEIGWKPPYVGAKQYLCSGIEDPAIKELTDEQLRQAANEWSARKNTARLLREQEEQRQRLVAMGQRDLEYRGRLAQLLTSAGWGARASNHLVTASLLEKVCDLVEEYQDRDNW